MPRRSNTLKGYLPTADCESSFTMQVKCRRVHLTVLFVALLVMFAATSTTLYKVHHKSMKEMKRASSATATDLSKRRSRQNLPSAVTAPKAATQRKPMEAGSKIEGSSERRGEIEKFFNDRIGTEKKKRKGMKAADKREKVVAVKEREKIEPIASSLSPNATFAACLLIKDDNEILAEWLAYHYQVIGLRHLIVAVDPLSMEYPTKILERWSTLTNMTIQEWNDDDYMPSDFLVYQKPPEKYMENATNFGSDLSAEDILEISNHRYRQRVFLAKCMKDHRTKGNSWVLHIDTDEYVVASKLLRQMKPDDLRVPPMDQPGAVLDLLQQAVSKMSQQMSYPCISMLRVLFGSVESSQDEILKEVPQEFNARHFESLRWRYHALPHNMTLHGNPKVILDVSAIPEERFPEDIVFSIHRPVQAYCHRNKEVTFTSFRKQPIAVNHYLGSWERYAGRNDKRRSRAVYDSKANVRRGKDDGNRLWLQGFVKTMGFDLARELLGDYYIAESYLLNHTISGSESQA